MRKLLVGILLLLGVLFVINHFAELENILAIAQQGDWRFFGLAVFVQVLWLLVTAGTYWAVFRALGIQRRIMRLVPVAAAANFVNIVAPSGGMSSLAVVISDAKRNKLSSAHAAVVQALFVLIEYIGFTFFLILGLIALSRSSGLNAPEIFAAGFLWFSALLLAGALYLGARSEKLLARTLCRIIRAINKVIYPIRKRVLFEEERAEKFAHQIAEGLVQVKENPRKLLLPIFTSATSKGLMLFVFLLMFLAFKVPLAAGTLFAAFALAYLFMIVSPTPAGIGVVEGLVTLSMVSMSVPLSAAAVLILGYRAVTFWLPLFFGMIAVQTLSLSS